MKIRKYDERTPIDWNLDLEFIIWLNKWFKEYKKNASKVVDLEYRKYKYKDIEYTQKQIIDRIIELTEDCKKKWFEISQDKEDKVNEIFDLFRLVFWSMWW